MGSGRSVGRLSGVGGSPVSPDQLLDDEGRALSLRVQGTGQAKVGVRVAVRVE